MPGGRPTSDPKENLLAVRLSDRHLRMLRALAQRDGVSLSEALRRLLDQQASPPPARARRVTAKERRDFDRVFAAFGLARTPRERPPQP
jgi:hypothetical protein